MDISHKMNASQIGALGEAAAMRTYQQHAFSIVARNFQNRRGKKFGEIDFIALKGGYLHFVEVKTRTAAGSFGAKSGREQLSAALESVSPKKRARIVLAAKYFLLLYPQFQGFTARFDVAIVQLRAFDKQAEKITIYSDCISES